MHVNEHGFTMCVLQDLYLTHTKVNAFILLFTCQWLCDDKTLASALKKKKKFCFPNGRHLQPLQRGTHPSDFSL